MDDRIEQIKRMKPVIDAAREAMRWWDGEDLQAFEALGKALDAYDKDETSWSELEKTVR